MAAFTFVPPTGFTGGGFSVGPGGIGASEAPPGPALDPADLPGFLWDSGEDPAIGTPVPDSVALNTSTVEVWVVSRGCLNTPVDLGDGSQAVYLSNVAGNTTTANVNLFSGGLYPLSDRTYWPRVTTTVHGFRCSGAHECAPFINGVDYPVATVNTFDVVGGVVGERVGGTLAFDGDIRRVLVFGSPVVGENQVKLLFTLRQRYGVIPYTRQVVCCGDSITAGYNSGQNVIPDGWHGGDYTYSYPYVMATAHRAWKVWNHGIASITIETMFSNDDTAIDPYLDPANLGTQWAVVFAGTNDLVIDDVDLAELQTRVTDYCAARRTAGWQVAYVEMMDRGDFSSGQRTVRNDFNAWLPSRVGLGIDVLITLPTGLSGLSPWVAHPELWDSDHVHLSRAGYHLLGGTVGDAMP